MIKHNTQIVASGYHIEIDESMFDEFVDVNKYGICVFINYQKCVTFITHSTFSNNKYNDGAIYANGIAFFYEKYVCFENNIGYRGSHYVIISDTCLINNTNEHADHTFHGPMASGTFNCHFNYNNATKSRNQIESPWHFYDSHNLSVTKYCQMSDTTSNSILSCNKIYSLIDIHLFNFINCSASIINSQKHCTVKFSYTECIFVLNPGIAIGSECIFNNCFSDGSIKSEGIGNTNGFNHIVFPDQILCLYNHARLFQGTVRSSKFKHILLCFISMPALD